MYISDFEGNLWKLCFVQYQFDETEHDVSILPHGNRKSSSKPYIRTEKSVLERIKREPANAKPRHTFDDISEERGGVLQASSASSLPRDKKQVTYLKSSHNSSKITNLDLASKRDPFLAMTVKCKQEESGDPYIRRVVTSPEPSVVLASDQQLDDMVKFCTDSTEFSILQVDPTYNLGDFSVTATEYDHLLLVSRTTGKPPLMIGPMLLHYKKETSSYDELVGYLTARKPALKDLKALGTDGETAIANAFQERCSNMVHVMCSIHFHRNIKRKLQELALPPFIISDIVADIFGRQTGTTKETGLIDSEDASEFRVRLQQCKKIWDGRELAHSLNRQPQFHSWFLKYKADDMEKHLLLPVRQKANLQGPFSTNRIECVNSMISDETNHQMHDMLSFAMQMKEMHARQRREVEWAIIDKGPFQLHPNLRHLEIPETEWFVNMTPEDRLEYISKVLAMDIPGTVCNPILQQSTVVNTSGVQKEVPATMPISDHQPAIARSPIPQPSSVVNTSNVQKEISAPESIQQNQISSRCLSISLEEVRKYVNAAGTFSVEGMYRKASELVTIPGNITAAPGCPTDARVVASRSGVKPHIVMPGKAKGQFVCETSCINWKSYGICSHVLATAHHANKLLLFLQWFERCGAKRLNLTNATRVGTPQHPGRKGGIGPRKRSTIKPTPVETYPRAIFQTSAVSAESSAQTPVQPPIYHPTNTQIEIQQTRNMVARETCYSTIPPRQSLSQNTFQTTQHHLTAQQANVQSMSYENIWQQFFEQQQQSAGQLSQRQVLK